MEEKIKEIFKFLGKRGLLAFYNGHALRQFKNNFTYSLSSVGLNKDNLDYYSYSIEKDKKKVGSIGFLEDGSEVNVKISKKYSKKLYEDISKFKEFLINLIKDNTKSINLMMLNKSEYSSWFLSPLISEYVSFYGNIENLFKKFKELFLIPYTALEKNDEEEIKRRKELQKKIFEKLKISFTKSSFIVKKKGIFGKKVEIPYMKKSIREILKEYKENSELYFRKVTKYEFLNYPHIGRAFLYYEFKNLGNSDLLKLVGMELVKAVVYSI